MNVWRPCFEGTGSSLISESTTRFILVTGIMRYRETSLFTGQGIQDLSMDPRYADLLGYTKEEIEQSFKRYIPLAADKLRITTDELWERLELYYSGFCYDNQASVKVYSPFAINQFFAPVANPNFLSDSRLQLTFEPFWMEISGAAKVLRSLFRARKYDAIELANKYMRPVILGQAAMTSPLRANEVTLDQIMLQSGLLSIKEIAEEPLPASTVAARSYNCELTNYEVASGFRTVLLAYMTNSNRANISPKLLRVQTSLLAGDIAKLGNSINQLLCNLRYDVFAEDDDKKERVYRTLFKLCMMSYLVNANDEVSNNHGRCDLVAKTQDTIYAFELKRIQSNTTEAKFALLDVAEQQMVKNDYGNNLIEEGKLLIWVVVVISDKYRQVCAWRTIKRTYSAAGTQIERHEGLVEPIKKVENQKDTK